MPGSEQLLVDRIPTPIGELVIIADQAGKLRAVDWTDHEGRMLALLARHCRHGFDLHPRRDPHGLSRALKAYFKGDLAAIEPLETATDGTPFQHAAWRELRRIPAGRAISYAELARRIGRPRAVRATGLANGANPISIVVPCHRVIGSDGSLTGYGGGIHRKRWLLAHEGCETAE
ncbi:methylated-DNA-[protein]-cysteine S-methyltransferase [Dongia mobilis]|uniref:Methylated-DNA--protein-cysteine methyltransferase n=1 Tax=Dongia mobilis TaxID=578943 RepID=A0A4R6WW62_9PROT|nr:methylated-DNA--[protein]-cysteine S-methyltransferase [Dongia mobilis]TDQ83272.1 methylated-DNA-[protein]-cysteine S-methyltransferase [Dongia mobilis]